MYFGKYTSIPPPIVHRKRKPVELMLLEFEKSKWKPKQFSFENCSALKKPLAFPKLENAKLFLLSIELIVWDIIDRCGF